MGSFWEELGWDLVTMPSFSTEFTVSVRTWRNRGSFTGRSARPTLFLTAIVAVEHFSDFLPDLNHELVRPLTLTTIDVMIPKIVRTNCTNIGYARTILCVEQDNADTPDLSSGSFCHRCFLHLTITFKTAFSRGVCACSRQYRIR